MRRRAPLLNLGAALLLTACGGGGSGGGAELPPAQLPGSEPAIGQAQSGKATYYAADGRGACSYDASADRMVAAMNAPQYGNSQVCGMCVEVSGPRGTIVVRIVDLCPECPAGDLDLSEQAFSLIADKAAGQVPISWVPVACQVSGPLAIRFKEGSSPFWIAVQVRNSRLPIRQIELQQGAGFVPLEQQPYNYAIHADNPGPGPFSFRITAIDGQQLIERDVPLREAAVVPGTHQFE